MKNFKPTEKWDEKCERINTNRYGDVKLSRTK